jgi:periplasmic protein TonB
MQRSSQVDIHAGYTLRVLASTVVALLVMIGLVRYWPAIVPNERPDSLYDVRGERVVTMEMIEPTRQALRAPPPPRPLPPIVVPNDVELAEEIIEIDAEITLNTGAVGGGGSEGVAEAGAPSFVPRAQEAPKPIRFVEPEYSREARRRKIRAQIVVEVRVDEKGSVLESRIIDRFIYETGPRWTPVRELGYGVEEAVLAAADRWRFVPARHNGRVVQSLATLEFTIGG